MRGATQLKVGLRVRDLEASCVLYLKLGFKQISRPDEPLLRYLTGDIVRSMPRGFRILGRERDLYFRPDGTIVSPSDVDAALPADFECWHYSLNQTGENRWDFHYVADGSARHRGVEEALSGFLGAGARVNAFRRKSIAPAASGKFALLKPLSAGIGSFSGR